MSKLEEIRQQKEEIKESEIRIQEALTKAGEEYERLRAEVGIPSSNTAANGQGLLGDGGMGRGLEDLGATPGREEGMAS